MMDITLILACITGACFFYYRSHRDKKWDILDKIPGPRVWPIIGNIVMIFNREMPWNTAFGLAKQYGPVTRLQLGPIPIVMLSSRAAIYEALVTKAKKLLTRPALVRGGIAFPEYQDIFFSPANDQWKVLRRSFLHTFKYYGSTKSHLESTILEVFQDLLHELESENGNAVDPRSMIFKYFGSIMHILDFGSKPTKESLDLMSVYEQELVQYLNPFGDGVAIEAFPWLRKTGLFKSVFDALEKVAENTKRIWNEKESDITVNSDFEAFTYDEGKIRERFYAATLKTLVATNRDKGFGEKQARDTIADSFFGGISTSTEIIHIFCNLMIHYPEVQTKLQEELDEILGENESAMITNDLKDEMPYLVATLYELLRYSTIVPLGVAHETEEDVVLGGYLIPKETTILINLWCLHHDDHWDEPFKFKPERFLDNDGKFVTAEHPNRLHMMAFGAGPRVCAGKILAINRLFVTIGNLMRHFSIHPDPEKGLVSCDPRDGIMGGVVTHVKRYTAKFVLRH